MTETGIPEYIGPDRPTTEPDLTLAAENARRSIMEIHEPESLEDFNEMTKEKQVLTIIRRKEGISAIDLNTFTKEVSNGGLRLLQYWLEGTTLVYVYVNKNHSNPSYIEPKSHKNPETGRRIRKRIPLPKIEDSVLFKILIDGSVIELYRWEEE